MIINKRSISCLVLALFTIVTISSPAECATTKKKAKAPVKSSSSRAQIAAASANPYLGAIVVDVATGKTIFEDNADKPGYPASMVKLMDLLIILDQIKKGALTLEDKITINAETALVGGSQVYLKQGEVFSVNDLLYAMIIQSANDAATALAIHIAGSKEGFIQLMNAKAAELGMKSTKFGSVHGLPPSSGNTPDVTTARDMSILCMELVKRPEALRYTSTTFRVFRQNPLFEMRSHNYLIGSLNGCDGLKTGYFRLAGFSISATAIRNDRRVIAVVMGSNDRKVRDAKAGELITSAFMNLPPLPPPKPVVTNIVQTVTVPERDKKDQNKGKGSNKKTRMALYAGLLVIGVAVVVRLFRLSSITRH